MSSTETTNIHKYTDRGKKQKKNPKNERENDAVV